MADLDTRIILAGRGIDPVAAFDRGAIAGQNALAARQNVDMSNLYRAQGANILAGDQNALNALAQISPEAAFTMQTNRQQVQANSFNMEQAKVKAARETEAYMGSLDQAQAAQEAAELRSMAEAAALANSPEQWAQTFAGTPYEAAWDQRAAVLEILGTQKSVVDRMFPAAPEPQDEYGRYAAEEAAAGRQPLSRIDYAKAKSPSLTVETLPDGTQRVTQGVGGGAAAPGITSTAMDPATLTADIDAILNDPSLPRVVGPLEGGGGNNIDEMSAGRRMYYGSDGLALIERIGQLQGKAWLDARQLLKGGGAITDYESKKAEQAMARLSRAKGEAEFREALIDLRDAVAQGLAKLQSPQQPPAEQPKAATGIPAVPQDVDPDLWPQIWEAMPEKDRALFQ